MAKYTGPKTTILKEKNGEAIIIAVIEGLPYGAPPIGTTVRSTEYGVLTCSGHQTSGSRSHMTVSEVSFTIKQ